MKQIKLIPRSYWKPILFALVDDEDYEFLSKFNWRYQKSATTIHAYATIDSVVVSMHSLILPSPSIDLTPDHINNNGLDNQRHNLRLATRSQQAQNSRKRQGCTVSTYKGVYFREERSKWGAKITIKGKRVYLGLFETEKLAAQAYNRAAMEFYGEFAKLNEFEKVEK
jgi:hypothetical protein